MAAVESGDKEAAQNMVDEAERKAGYTKRAYHGTPHGTFTVFDHSHYRKNNFPQNRLGVFFSEDLSYAEGFSRSGGTEHDIENGFPNAKVYDVYLRIKKTAESIADRNAK